MKTTEYPHGITDDEFSAASDLVGHVAANIDYFDDSGLGAQVELVISMLSKLSDAAKAADKSPQKHRKVY